MRKFGVCAWSIPVEGTDVFEFCAKIGLDGVSLNANCDSEHKLLLEDKALADKYLNLAKKYNVEISTLALNVFCHFGMCKKENFEIAKTVFQSVVKVAKYMGIKKIQVPSFVNGYIRTDEELEQTIKCLEFALTLFRGTDIDLGYENALNYEQNMYVYEKFKNERYFVYYDTQNPLRFAGDKNPEILAEKLMPYIKELHVKDSFEDVNIPLQLGEGTTNFNESIQKFIDAKYDGYIIMESEYKKFPDFETVIKKDLENLKLMFA